MKMFEYPLATSTWDDAEYAAMQRVIRSGMFSMGAEVSEFEREFSEFVKSKFAVMVNSGSSANLLMIASLFYTKQNRLKRGDEVIVPAVSWSTTYFPLYQYGLKLKFVDVDLNTLNYDLNKLAEAITPSTRLVVAVNLLGNPNDFNEINRIIAGTEIQLIEDNCESLGAVFNGRQAGTFGRLGSFSMYFSHHISTMEGGVVVTDDEELYHILLSLRAHGWTRDLPQDNLVVSKSTDPHEELFRFVLPGYNVRPLEISGAIGREQLKKLPDIIAARRKNASYFVECLDSHSDIIIQRETGQSSWFGFSLIIRPNSSLQRRDLLDRIHGAGFETRPIVAGNFCKNEVVKYFDYTIFGDLSNASHIDRMGLFVGNHHFSVAAGIEAIVQALR